MKPSEALEAFLEARDAWLRVRGHRAYEPTAYAAYEQAKAHLDEAFAAPVVTVRTAQRRRS